ncbi:MAG: aspartate carbamoyltransferase regulatory subunit [Caldisericia bacterium]|jgi:aspartate carbamoyltransferase regulatory subunit|nr:aspartate carbamoyltransferase regulatory subunit [Caldisericia bacterium]MDD5689243.1 aspartate carbamoyltransferase regulatory subunit [Caldisericia bacterium]HOJ16600.1 aspartate carbamoyltransferase regulatory subunit [Caldisericia bacterium]HOW03290.1 aspartate carbamoyltransferase regulatory subunit [Caldisericia bacterium]HPO28984.1 aspartate carbamoyltransferase regulatory subunit [Caldisericia bacterium]
MKMQMITNGTVIDHLPVGKGLRCFELLKRHNLGDAMIIIFLNVPSNRLERKDMIKIEGFYLDEETSTYLSLIAPHATINIIDNSKVIKKINPVVPTEIKGLIKCINSRCITNTEGYIPEYEVKSVDPVILKCKYCEFEFYPD